MKKLIVTFALIALVFSSVSAHIFDLYADNSEDDHVPRCYFIKCPKCEALSKKGLAERSVARRTFEDKDSYIEYRCYHGHQLRIHYIKDGDGKLKKANR